MLTWNWPRAATHVPFKVADEVFGVEKERFVASVVVRWSVVDTLIEAAAVVGIRENAFGFTLEAPRMPGSGGQRHSQEDCEEPRNGGWGSSRHSLELLKRSLNLYDDSRCLAYLKNNFEVRRISR